MKCALACSFLFLSLSAFSSAYAAEWGAEAVGEEYRYDDTWESVFDDATVVVVDDDGTGDVSTINAGISMCTGHDFCHIQVKSGTYEDFDTPSSEFYISRSNVRISGEPDGSSILKSDSRVFFYLSGVSGIIIENFTFQGKLVTEPNSYDGSYTTLGAVLGFGSNMRDISIRNNAIRGLKVDNSQLVPGNFRNGAFAISFAGVGASEESAIQNVQIKNNHVEDMANGHSENISVGGNIKQWEIIGNTIKDVTNIGIDAGGGYRNSTVHALDAARYGFIEGNVVTDLVESEFNIDGVGAIYVDGGSHIHIANNTVIRAPQSFYVGAEECIVVSDITIVNNTSIDSGFEDIALGGYSAIGYEFGDPVCTDPNDNLYGGFGSVRNLTISGNTLNSPDNVRNGTSMPYNSSTPFADPDPSDPDNAYSAFPLQLAYRVGATLIDQLGIDEMDNDDIQIRKSAPGSQLSEATISSVSVPFANEPYDKEAIIDNDTTTWWENDGRPDSARFTVGLDDTYLVSRIRFQGLYDTEMVFKVDGQEVHRGWLSTAAEHVDGGFTVIDIPVPVVGSSISVESLNSIWIIAHDFKVYGEIAPGTVYEDAEDQSNQRWSIVTRSGTTPDSTVSAQYDDERESWVMELERGSNRFDKFALRKAGGSNWNNTDSHVLAWSHKIRYGYTIQVAVRTSSNTTRYLRYRHNSADSDFLHSNGRHLYFGLGAQSRDDTWKSFTRDLESDLKVHYPNETITRVYWLRLIGRGGLVDDIKLLD